MAPRKLRGSRAWRFENSGAASRRVSRQQIPAEEVPNAVDLHEKDYIRAAAEDVISDFEGESVAKEDTVTRKGQVEVDQGFLPAAGDVSFKEWVRAGATPQRGRVWQTPVREARRRSLQPPFAPARRARAATCVHNVSERRNIPKEPLRRSPAGKPQQSAQDRAPHMAGQVGVSAHADAPLQHQPDPYLQAGQSCAAEAGRERQRSLVTQAATDAEHRRAAGDQGQAIPARTEINHHACEASALHHRRHAGESTTAVAVGVETKEPRGRSASIVEDKGSPKSKQAKVAKEEAQHYQRFADTLEQEILALRAENAILRAGCHAQSPARKSASAMQPSSYSAKGREQTRSREGDPMHPQGRGTASLHGSSKDSMAKPAGVLQTEHDGPPTPDRVEKPTRRAAHSLQDGSGTGLRERPDKHQRMHWREERSLKDTTGAGGPCERSVLTEVCLQPQSRAQRGTSKEIKARSSGTAQIEDGPPTPECLDKPHAAQRACHVSHYSMGGRQDEKHDNQQGAKLDPRQRVHEVAPRVDSQQVKRARIRAQSALARMFAHRQAKSS